MKKARKLVLLILFLIGMGCSDDRIFENFQEINSANWGVKDTVRFDLNKLEMINRKSLIAIRFNESYAYSNCYLRIISYDSIDNILENKLINMPLFDSKSGEPLGKGVGNTYTKYDTIPYDINPKTSSLAVIQYMRTDLLKGIESVGIKILK
jgi:gliding motility-associated lipoprotein GldH